VTLRLTLARAGAFSAGCCRAIASRGHSAIVVLVNDWYGLRTRCKRARAGAAVGLFVCLIFLMGFFSIRAMSKGKRSRAIVYRSISVLMVVGIAGIIVAGKLGGLENYIFYLEFWGLSLSGIGWFIAGSYKTAT